VIVALPLLLAAAAPHAADDRPRARIAAGAILVAAQRIVFTHSDRDATGTAPAASPQDRQRSATQTQILIEFH